MNNLFSLLVDFGYAFDYLSIQKIKMLKNPTTQNIENFLLCSNHLKQQITDQLLWEKIIYSAEFQNLMKANNNTYEAVEKARYGKISAKTVDEHNMQRFYAKKAIQTKFFFDTEQTETKT